MMRGQGESCRLAVIIDEGLMNGMRFPLAAILAFAIAGVSTPSVYAAEPDVPQEVITRMDAVYITVLDHLASKGKKSLGLDKADEKGLTDYYMNRENSLLWVGENGMNDRVKQLRVAFGRAEEWGLNSSDYVPASNKGFGQGAYPAVWLAEAELKTSIAAYTYARHAQTGRFDPEALNESLDKHPARPDVTMVLKGMTSTPEKIPAFLESFHPQHEQFKALKRLLADAKGGAKPAADEPVTKIPDGPSLGPGTSHPQIAILRERLNVPASRNAPADADPDEYYDDRLAEAVRAFQKAKGLPAKGVVNAVTRQALNKSAPSSGGRNANANTIIANMERWRWEPRDLGTRYIRVNVPEFMFRVTSNGKVIHEERIVAGSKEHMTPLLNDEMEYIVFNPYWNVPESILTKEILPAIRRDPSFLDRNKLEVVWQGRRPRQSSSFWGGDDYGVDWETVDARKMSLRQIPGAGNALGNVKFAFPNKHSVYMHDTPTKHLFNQSVRAYSHGCMRVRNPLKFAEVLLADQGWNSGRINSTLDTAHDEQVTLAKKVPIHIQYFTLWVNDDGKLQQFGDIYGHDNRVKVALKLEKAPKPERENSDKEAANERGLGN